MRVNKINFYLLNLTLYCKTAYLHVSLCKPHPIERVTLDWVVHLLVISNPNFCSFRFGIFLGCDPKNFAVHFNPRWDDPQDGTIIVVNSMTNSVWEHEIREANTLQRGSYVTVRACSMMEGNENAYKCNGVRTVKLAPQVCNRPPASMKS